MKRALAIVAGVVVGMLLSGAVAAALIPLLPAPLQSAGTVWATTAVVVALAVLASWMLSAPGQD